MADLKLEQQITDQIAEQNKLLEDGRRTDKSRIPIKQKINELERELFKISGAREKQNKNFLKLQKEMAGERNKAKKEVLQQLKNKKTAAQLEAAAVKAEKDHQDISNDLNKGIFARIASVGKLKGLSFITGQNLKTQLSQTTELKRHTSDLVKDITTESEFMKFNAKDRATMIDLSKGLADGTYDEIDAQETLQNLSEDGLNVIEQQEGGMKGLLDVFTPIAAAKKEEVAAGERAEKIEERKAQIAGVNKKLNLGIAAAFALGLKIATKFAEIVDGIGKQFGSLNVMGPQFQKDLMASSVEAQKLGGGMEDVASITNTLASNFGMNVDEAAKLSSKVFDTSKAIGISADEGANLFGVLTQTANLSADQAERLAEGAFQLARQAKVSPSAVMRDIAGSAEEIAAWTKDGGNNIAEAAVQARQMGLSLSTTAKIAEGLLDFENSINKEIEASVLIGKQLNFQRARQLALSGDIVGATKDIVSQLGSEAEFNALNLIQRKALADSIGVSVGEMAKMISATDKLTLSGALAAGSFDDLTGQEALSNLSSITGEFKSLLSEALVAIGPEIEKLIGNFRTFIKESGGVVYLKETFLSLVDLVKSLVRWLPHLVAGFATLKAAAIGVSIAQSMAALTKGGLTMGIPGIVLTAAALGAAFAGIKSLMSFDELDKMKGAVLKGGPSTKAVAQIQGGEGVFQEKGLQEMFGGFGTQNTYQRSFGLTAADAEMIGNAMASKLSLKTEVKSGNLQVAMNTVVNPIGGDPLIRKFG
tara:strand:- start:343 stop:2631 length:2289 start_codon:yes stop_codon:yes gene_type:complete